MTGDGSLRRRALGWGLRSTEILPGADLGRDLELVDGPGGRDLSLVADVENLAQCLQLALTTRLGDDVFNSGFGFDGVRVLAEPTAPGLAREQVRVAVLDTVRRDPRVRRIVDLQVLDHRLARAGTAEVVCAVETTSGEPVSISLDGVVNRA